MSEADTDVVRVGETVYDETGRPLGEIRGIDSDGFYVRAAEDVAVLDPSEEASSDARMWRCWECGEMGRIAEMPDRCPACDAPREEIYYWVED